jgi:outer membrane protein TolC
MKYGKRVLIMGILSATLILTGFVSLLRAEPPAKTAANPLLSPPATLTPETTLSLDECIAKLFERSPSITALQHRLAAARLRIQPAAALPDPMLELTGSVMGLVPPTSASSLAIEYRQDLPYPGKRKARQESAEAEAALTGAEVAALKRELVTQVRLSYAQIYSLDREKYQVGSAQELLTLLSKTASSGYSAGESSLEALLKIQIELVRLQARHNELAAERANQVALLTRLFDDPAVTRLGEITQLPPIDLPPPNPLELAAQNSPEIVTKQRQVALAERKVAEARMEEKPDFSVGVGSGLNGMAQPLLMLRFGVQIPAWRQHKQARLTEASAAELQASLAEQRAAVAFTRSEADRLTAQWQADEQLLKQYQESIIPQSYSAFEAAQAAYLSNQGDFSTIIEDFRMWLEAKMQFARLEADRFMTWALLQRLIASPTETWEKDRLK